MKPIDVPLTYDSIIALLQGKELHIQTADNHFIFRPPFNGVFVTHDELDMIRSNAQDDLFALLRGVSQHTQ